MSDAIPIEAGLAEAGAGRDERCVPSCISITLVQRQTALGPQSRYPPGLRLETPDYRFQIRVVQMIRNPGGERLMKVGERGPTSS